MKRTILTIVAVGAASIMATAQTYTVSGQAPEGCKTIYFRNAEAPRSQVPDSVVVGTDGKFMFKGEAEGKLFAVVSTKDQKGIPVVLDGNVTVDFATATASGTDENKALSEWNATHEQIYSGMYKLVEEYNALRRSGKEIPDSTEQRINAQYLEGNDKLVANLKACCEANMTAKFPAYFLRNYSPLLSREDLIGYADKDAAFMKVSATSRLRSSIKGWRNQVAGAPLVDFEMADTTGTTHKLSEFIGHGQYVLVDFWASWCGPCRQEMPNVKAAYAKYHDKGFDIVGLSFDNKREAWTAAIKKLELPWHQLSDLKGWKSIAAETYGIDSIPATILFDPAGKVVATDLRGEALAEKLAEFFK